MKAYNYIEHNNRVKHRHEDGFFKIENDKLAIEEYELEIEQLSKKFPNYLAKLKWLIENDYYINLLETYSEKYIEELADIVYGYNFKFQSFMAISKFYTSYALKTNDGDHFLESYEDRIIACSLFLGNGEEERTTKLARSLIEQRYQPATPTFLNSARKHSGELISCFLLEVGDSLNSINYNLSTAMQLSKIGGGVALNLSKLRARTEEIKGIEGVAQGVLPVLKLLEDAFSYVDQLGQRPGAGAAYLNIFHSDVMEFLDTKKINADEKTRIQSLSLGLVVPDKFWELARDDKELNLFYPYTIYKEYGIHLAEMDLNVMYDELVANPNVRRKKMKAREMLQMIATTQFESGYPYIIYEGTANAENPLKDLGKIKMSNLCTEIFQIQTESHIADYGEEDAIGYDINCNLGSLNIVNVMEHKNFADTIDVAMRALTQVSEISDLKNAPGVKKANDDFHSVGLGAMNLHGYLAKNLIRYDSLEAIEFTDAFFMLLNYHSIVSSNNIAKEKGQAFKDFEKSEYAKGTYFHKYLETEFEFKFEKIANLFEGIQIPTISDWEALKLNVQTYGLYNSYRLAIAPTQSISYVQNSTAAIQPVVDLIETRMYGNSITYYPMPFLERKNVLYYKSAYVTDQFKMIDLIAAAQKHIDQGISTILYVDSSVTTAQLAKLYYYAWSKGLKALYYTRTKNLSIEECLTCSV